jgi:predicted RND superfamily exporter protein
MKQIEKKLAIASWITMVMLILGTIYFVREMKNNAYMETDLDEYMPKTHPAFVYSDQAEEWFNINDGILIAIENPQGIYNTESLSKIKDISIKLQEMSQFDENDVMSLYTADNIVGSEDGMDVQPFFGDLPLVGGMLDSLRNNVKSNDMVFGRMVSTDETVALIVASMEDDAFTDDFYNEIMTFAKSYEDGQDKIYVAGRPIIEGTLGQLGPEDMKRMVPIVMLVISLVLLVLLRSFRATFITLSSVLISTIWAFGLMAAVGVPIYSVSTMMPVMLIAIGVAYGIYFYNHLNKFFVSNPYSSNIEAVLHTVKVLWKPLTMAAFTTMIGFFSLLTSEVYPIKFFGLFTAFGIFMAYVLALVFLPATILIIGNKKRKIKINDDVETYTLMNRITDKLLANKKIVYLSLAVILVVSVVGIQKVWINSSFLEKFEPTSEIAITDGFVNQKFGGTSTLNVILESDDYDAFKQPENLVLVDALQTETEQLMKVGNSFSLADYIKRMNKVMNADDESFYSIPESSEMIAQYLLLYEMSGDPENLVKVVNYDYNKLNVTFQLKGDDSKTINEALAVIDSFKTKFDENGIQVKYAGSGYKALIFSDLILEGQIKSIIMSMVLVFLLLVVMFRNLKAGLIGSIPIVVTALISFGVMGLSDIALSTTTALLSSIAIGIGVDYAIHFLQNYKVYVRKTDSRHDAIHETMKHTGSAIFSNALVVIAGFLVMLFSVFPPNRMLGLLVSMNMFTSFVGTLSIMMILVYTTKVFLRKGVVNEKQKKFKRKNN